MEPPNYTQQLLLQLNQQRSKGYLCDVIIVVENSLFRAHKNVLAACSSYFKYLVLQENLITLNTEMVKPSVFNQVLDFIYTGQLPSLSHFGHQGVCDLLRAASYLQLSELAALCRLKLKNYESTGWPSTTTASSFGTSKCVQVSRSFNAESLEVRQSLKNGLQTEDVSEDEVEISDQTGLRLELTREDRSESTSSSLQQSSPQSGTSSSEDLPPNSASAFRNPSLELWYPRMDWQRRSRYHEGDRLEGSVQAKEPGELIQEDQNTVQDDLIVRKDLQKSEETVSEDVELEVKHGGYVYHQQQARFQSSTHDSPYLCIPCGEGFTSSEQLIAHVDSHKTEDPEHERLLKMDAKYSENLPTEEPKADKMPPHSACSVCGKIFVDPALLDQHERSHSLSRPFSCDVCGKLFTQRGTMTRHMRSHLGVKPFACEECGMRFTRQYRKMEHMRIHSREKPYQCQLCGARFTHQRSVISHLKMHAMVP